jgi:hypothetical protein
MGVFTRNGSLSKIDYLLKQYPWIQTCRYKIATEFWVCICLAAAGSERYRSRNSCGRFPKGEFISHVHPTSPGIASSPLADVHRIACSADSGGMAPSANPTAVWGSEGIPPAPGFEGSISFLIQSSLPSMESVSYQAIAV